MIKLSEKTIFADRYQFQRLLGRGGFSEVWLAVDKMTNLEIAVKVYAPGQGMDTDGMKDFCKELSQVYNLNHTNLLKPQHVDSWEGMPYLVMTYCPKGSCHRQIGTMTEEQIWKMLHDMASGLAYLHEQGIIHQDIKPDNILIDPMGNYVITDFGISVQSRSTLRKSMNIASGSGTTAYMGPERFSTDPTPLKASDIWSLGATAYELLTGNAPFGEIGGGMQKGGADLPTIKQNISAELRMALSKMLALNTWDRPTAEQLVKWTENPKQIDFSATGDTTVRSTVTNQPFIPTQPTIPPTPTTSKSKKGLIIGLITAAVVALLGFGIWYMQTKKIDKNRIEKIREIHRNLGETCDTHIAELNGENVLEKVEDVVLAIRDMERFENDGYQRLLKDVKLTPYTMKPRAGDKIIKFRRKLNTSKASLEKVLDTKSQRYDKSAPVVVDLENKITRINEVLDDIDKSETKSANDIHLISDNL